MEEKGMTVIQYQAKLAEFDERVYYLKKQLADAEYDKQRFVLDVAKQTVIGEQEALKKKAEESKESTNK